MNLVSSCEKFVIFMCSNGEGTKKMHTQRFRSINLKHFFFTISLSNSLVDLQCQTWPDICCCISDICSIFWVESWASSIAFPTNAQLAHRKTLTNGRWEFETTTAPLGQKNRIHKPEHYGHGHLLLLYFIYLFWLTGLLLLINRTNKALPTRSKYT